MTPRLNALARAAALLTLAAPGLAGAGNAPPPAPFTLWVTETPAGGTAPYTSQFKGGVRAYTFDGLGYSVANYSAGALIPAAGLNDPSDVEVAADGSLLLANRGFNSGPGSVSQVTFTAGVPNAPTVLLSNTSTGPHQLAITGTGDLVVSSFNSGGKLYPGGAAPATVTFATGAQRGAVAEGNLLYSTSGSGSLQVFNLGTGAQVGSSFSVAGASLLHYGTSAGGNLFFADIGSGPSGAGGGVFMLTLDANGNPVSSSRVASVDGAISVTFSPTGDEMFVAGHFSGVITGFAVGPGNTVAAAPNLVIDGGTLASWGGAHVAFGGMDINAALAVPEPGTYALMLGGLVLLGAVVRRRSR